MPDPWKRQIAETGAHPVYAHEATGITIRRDQPVRGSLHQRKETTFDVYLPGGARPVTGAFRLADAKDEAEPFIRRIATGKPGPAASRTEIELWLRQRAAGTSLTASVIEPFIQEHLGWTVAEIESAYPADVHIGYEVTYRAPGAEWNSEPGVRVTADSTGSLADAIAGLRADGAHILGVQRVSRQTIRPADWPGTTN